jgi:hypothetical protein
VSGWSSQGLELVGEDERLWTVEEASRLLGPPALSTALLRRLVAELEWEAVGTRQADRPDGRGRQPRVYRAIDFIRVYEGLSQAA